MLVDHAPMVVAALDPLDQRAVVVEVAGAAALLVAKAHKIHDRIAAGRAHRLDDKDAADVYRLMQSTSPVVIGERLAALRRDPIAGTVVAAAVDQLGTLFGRRAGLGITMTSRALRGVIPEAQIETLATGYATRMLDAFDASR